MPADCPGEHGALQVAALLNQISNMVAMRDPQDILLDNRTLVQVVGNVMARCADQFDATLECGVTRARAGKGWQERVVNVNDPPWVFRNKLGREHLHVGGKDDEIGSVRRQQAELAVFNRGLIGAAQRKVEIRNPIELRKRLAVVGVVTHNAADFAW